MAYMGPPVLVADVVLWPDRSILKQSYDARERKMDASLPQHLVCYTCPATSLGLCILMQLMAMLIPRKCLLHTSYPQLHTWADAVLKGWLTAT